MSKKFEATLVKGETYYLGNMRFERGKPEIVTLEQKRKLDKNAVDRATIISGDEKSVTILPKFKFKAVSDTTPTKAERGAKLAEIANASGDVDFEDDDLDDADLEDDEEYEDESDEDLGDDEADEEEAPPAPEKPAKGKGKTRSR